MADSTKVFIRLIESLHQVGAPWMLTGSFAAAVYGRPRATQDIDLVIETDEATARSLAEALVRHGFYADPDAAAEAVRAQSLFNAIDDESGWKVDFVIRKHRPFSQQEFRRRETRRISGLDLSVVRAEDLVIAKLEWAKQGQSERQLDDVASILALQGDALDLDHIDRWVRELGLWDQWEAVKPRNH